MKTEADILTGFLSDIGALPEFRQGTAEDKERLEIDEIKMRLQATEEELLELWRQRKLFFRTFIAMVTLAYALCIGVILTNLGNINVIAGAGGGLFLLLIVVIVQVGKMSNQITSTRVALLHSQEVAPTQAPAAVLLLNEVLKKLLSGK